MTNAPGSNFDVFISYAHVDNEPLYPAKHGWVTVLVDNLGRYLAKRLGRREAFSNWYDQHQLKGNQGIANHIPEQARKSAVFLAILSPGYVASEFCLRELEAFIESHRGAVAERLFVVEHMPLGDRQQIPEAFRDIRNYRFYKLDENQIPRTLAQPEPLPDEREYFQKIDDIAREMTQKLSSIGSAKTSKPTVLVAEVTDDLEARRDEVLRYLDQAGFDALPSSCYRLVREDFERSLASDLAKCTAFVQLLGPVAGKRPPDLPDGFGWLQLELAKRTDLPILQWRSPDLDVTKVELPMQRRLLELETVRSVPFEDFKRTIVERVQRTIEHAKAPPSAPAASASMLFINADAVDKASADAIKDSLGGRFGWAVPLSLYNEEAKPDELQQDMETNLINSEGLVIVYGAARPAWVSSAVATLPQARPAPAEKSPLACTGRSSARAQGAAPDLPAWLGDGRHRSDRRSCEQRPVVSEIRAIDEPYPGLRSFRRDETHIFFGREAVINVMVDRLAAHRFLAVTGTSGSGKSSLVRTGLLDAIDRGLLAAAGADWRVADFHPGRGPLAALADALIAAVGSSGAEHENLQVEAALARGPYGLVEWLNGTELSRKTNILLLVDQFEEIFRFRSGPSGDDIDAFVALLLASAKQAERPIYVVLTMRSDFLGECAQFSGLAEAINDGQFLTPRMTREQSQSAIEGPAAVFGGRVSPLSSPDCSTTWGPMPTSFRWCSTC